jgi:hypothetical protein
MRERPERWNEKERVDETRATRGGSSLSQSLSPPSATHIAVDGGQPGRAERAADGLGGPALGLPRADGGEGLWERRRGEKVEERRK